MTAPTTVANLLAAGDNARAAIEAPDRPPLTYAALRGMLSSLDPHSQFLDEESFQDIQRETKGEFSGLGIVIGVKDGGLVILSPMEDSPGYRAGILPHDQIIKIEGKSTSRIDLEDAVKELRGNEGTSITITIRRPSTGMVKDYTLVRANIKVD